MNNLRQTGKKSKNKNDCQHFQIKNAKITITYMDNMSLATYHNVTTL